MSEVKRYRVAFLQYGSPYWSYAAVVKTDQGYNECFRICNHIDDDWWDNPEVKIHLRKQQRSMSIGDYVRDEDDNMFLCMPDGWQQVNSTKEAVEVLKGTFYAHLLEPNNLF